MDDPKDIDSKPVIFVEVKDLRIITCLVLHVKHKRECHPLFERQFEGIVDRGSRRSIRLPSGHIVETAASLEHDMSFEPI
jgi:hypothetical protein